MNPQFPTVKTYSRKWQRSYRLYQENNKLFDTVQSSTTAKTVKDVSKTDQHVEPPKKSINPRSRLSSKGSVQTQATQKSLQATQKSPKRLARPVTVTSLPNRASASSRALSISPAPRPITVSQTRTPAVTGRAMITKPLRRYGVPAVTKTEANRSPDTPSPPKTLRVETLFKYRPDHAEKVYCKNDSYIHAWLRGVEEATAHNRRPKHCHDTESSIELLREAEIEHPALARKNSASELLKDMINAFKSSSMEQSTELSKIREQPSLPEKPSSPTQLQTVPKVISKGQEQKSLKRSRIPCLSRTKTTLTTTYSYSANQASTPTVTRSDDNSNQSYTYRWTVESGQTSDAGVLPRRVLQLQEKGGKKTADSPTICIADLKQYKKLNSTTRPKAKSLGKVEFSQCLSPILNDAERMQKSAESTPDTNRKRVSDNKENVVPRKQRCVGSKKIGQLEPKASTVLFTSQTINSATTPDVSSIRMDKGQKTKPTELNNSDLHKKSFDFDAAEKESVENKEKQPMHRPMITSTPDSQRNYIRPELMILADLSSVATPSATDDDLIPLRTSGFEVNSDEIVCTSDLDLEVDIPPLHGVGSPETGPSSSEQQVFHKEPTGLDSTYTVTPQPHTATSKPSQTTNKLHSVTSQSTKVPTGVKNGSRESSHSSEASRTSKPRTTAARKVSTNSVAGIKLSETNKTLRQNKTKGPVASLYQGKAVPKASTVPRASAKRSVTNASQEIDRPRWKYFSRASNSFSAPIFPVMGQRRRKRSSGTSSRVLPCSLVALQRHGSSAHKTTIKISVRRKTTDLVMAFKEAPPDDIMTTARKLSKQRHKVES